MPDTHNAPAQAAASYADFLRAIERGERARRRGLLRFELLRVAAALLVLTAAILWMNAAIPALAPVAGPLLLAGLGASGVLAWRSASRARAPYDPRAAALLVESRDGELGRDALLAIDLWALREEGREHYSTELVHAEVARRAASLARRDFAGVFEAPRARPYLAAGGAGAVLGILALVLIPAATARLLHGGAPRPSLVVTPGDARVLAGDSLLVRVETRGAAPGDAVWLELAGGGEIAMTPAGSSWEHTFPRVLRGFEYRARSGDTTSPGYTVSITERPRVTEVAMVVHPPSYTGAEPELVRNADGHFAALRGSRVELTVRSSVPLDRATLAIDSTRTTDMRVSEDGASASAAITVERSTTYRIALGGRDGYASLPDEGRAIVALDDEPPVIRFIRPEPRVTLGADPSLALTLSAVDDYGLGPVVLHYRVTRGDADTDNPEKSLTLGAPGGGRGSRRELDIDHGWDLRDLDLGPGDVLSYWASVRDNDAVTGPKESRTPVQEARFPGVEEIFAQVTGESEEQRASLEDVAREGRELKQKMDELARDAAKDRELSWEEKQKVEETLERQREIQSKLGDVVQSLEQNAQTAEEHNLLSAEVMQRMAELAELMRQVATPEMMRAMERMREQMSQVSPEELARAMKQLSLDQEELLKRLERTIALLKRFELEQRLEEMVARADELLSRQDKVMEELDAKEASLGDLATREERVSADTERLQKDAEALAEELRAQEGADSKSSESLEEASESLEEEGVKQDLNDASRKMTAGDRQGARSSGSKGRHGQQRFRDRMALAQNQFNEALRNEITAEMKRASREVLALSLDEEKLAGRMKESDAGNDRAASRSLAADQQDLLGGLRQVADRLMKLGEKTMFVNPAIGRSLGTSLSRMGQAVNELSDGRTSPAGESANTAITAMNETVIELRKAEDQASSCQSPSGMAQMMETLSQASCDQAGLNQQTKQVADQMGGQQGEQGETLSDAARAQMSRLAAEQRAISESLRRAIEEQGGGQGGPLGRLDRTLDEMKQTMEELEQGRINAQTTERQERILSRLLDAQRSARRRDFEERRTSRPGEIRERLVSPAPLPDALTRIPAAMREDLLRAANERYPAEYEALIREYFRSLWSGEAQ